MVTRQEYQKLVGNLHHIHLLAEVPFDQLTTEQKAFVDGLARCSIFDVVRIHELQDLYNDGTFENVEDYKDMINDASNFLRHNCNSRCLVLTPDGKFRCRKLNYLQVSKDNTKHTYQDFNNDISQECLDRLRQIGMIDPLQINEHGFEKNGKVNFPSYIPEDTFLQQTQTMTLICLQLRAILSQTAGPCRIFNA